MMLRRQEINLLMEHHAQNGSATGTDIVLNNGEEEWVTLNETQIVVQAGAGNYQEQTQAVLVPPPGEWQHVPGYGLLYRDVHTGNVLRAPSEDYNPGPFVVNLKEIGLSPQLYILRGPHYRSGGILTYQQQWELDAVTGGRLWGGYDNYHGFELIEHAETRLTDDGAVTTVDEGNVEGSNRGAVEVFERAKKLTNGTLGREVKPTHRFPVNKTAEGEADGQSIRTPNSRASTNRPATSLKGNTRRTESDRKREATMRIFNRFKNGKSSIFSSLPGPYTRLPHGLVLTTVEILT
jgi:hypothetical protein